MGLCTASAVCSNSALGGEATAGEPCKSEVAFQLSKNRSMKWSGAVSAFGVGLGGSTQYDKEHKQRITAGDRKNFKHYIWGKNDSVSGKPGVFYSY